MNYSDLDKKNKNCALKLLKKKGFNVGQSVPTYLIPTQLDLADWYLKCSLAVRQQAQNRVDAIFGDKVSQWQWSLYVSGLVGTFAMKDHPLGKNGEILPILALIAVRKNENGGESIYIVSPPEFYFKIYEEARKNNKELKNPLIPIIEEWQNRLHPISPYIKEISILPLFYKLISPKKTQSVPEPSDGNSLLIPAKHKDSSAPFFALYDMLGGKSLTQGASAPVALRIFMEAQLSMPLEGRDGNPYHINISIREIVENWLLWDPKNYRPNRDDSGGLLQKSFKELQDIEIPFGEHGAFAPVLKRAHTGWRLKDKIWLEIVIPSEIKYGPMVNRLILRKAGRHSAPVYRAYLNLCCFWNRYGTSHRPKSQKEKKLSPNGEHVYNLIKPTRQKVMRDAKGRVVNKNGELILYGNQPTTSSYARGAVQTGERELNQYRIRYKEFDAEGLLSLCFPMHELKPGNVREYTKRSREAIKYLESIMGCTIERLGNRPHNGCLPWRIMPFDSDFKEILAGTKKRG